MLSEWECEETYDANEAKTVCITRKMKKPVEIGGVGNQ